MFDLSSINRNTDTNACKLYFDNAVTVMHRNQSSVKIKEKKEKEKEIKPLKSKSPITSI